MANFGLVFAMALIVIGITIIINSVVLWLALRQFSKVNDYGKALKTAAISGVTSFFIGQALTGIAASFGNPLASKTMFFVAIPLVALAINYQLLRRLHGEKGKKATIIAALWTILAWLLSNTIASFILIYMINGTGTNIIEIPINT